MNNKRLNGLIDFYRDTLQVLEASKTLPIQMFTKAENEEFSRVFHEQREKLMKQGYKVKVSHGRWYWETSPEDRRIKDNPILTTRYVARENDFFGPETKGGKTYVAIVAPDGAEYVGMTLVSEKDNYNRKYGRLTALQRAMTQKRDAGVSEVTIVH